MATAKSAGAAKYGRDSNPKYLGVKLHDGEKAKAGSIIIRQRGRHYFAGTNVRAGGDDTLYAAAPGTVKFATKHRKRFDGSRRIAKYVHIFPSSIS
ncbi:MAG: 50S ribosomal protein L27 [Candidatus Sungbacteria bacterium RIFCSPHIGHO2_02_FULL_49_12]|uniref:Large ribosomal subunit protein bL27 n=1 Tax=Candidatus Sungbacteria bacterium RIFCSPHIGHO2_02_FULL_49_12 TaxID=1802271 RepID=A0A1G2KS82_9BACT|nr:MAG: 50S ribosomal protein L27 [Candidatus Sungbacteria bacterium RIFCSPHIGHO2_02_FULL_49_12]